jgi:hypothetical protein
MKAVQLKATVAVVIVCTLWVFVGVERIVGDHEVGISWEAFIKHRPSVQLKFQNPAQKGLELIPFEALSLADQTAFIEFCAIRFGTTNTAQCRAIILERVV